MAFYLVDDYLVYLGIGAFLGFLTLFGYQIIFRFWIEKKDARVINKASRQHKPIALMEYDGKSAELFIPERILPEGILESKDKTFLQPRIVANLLHALKAEKAKETLSPEQMQQTSSEKIDETEIKNPLTGEKVTEDELNKMQAMMTQTCVLKNVGVPLYAGYAAKLPISNLKALALLNLKPESLGLTTNQTKELYAFFPVDPLLLKAYIGKMYTQAQVNVVRLKGIERGKKEAEKRESKFAIYIPIITLVIGLLIGIVVGKV
jgi:hydroxymethylpyrimidine pyrophosphatase-like HAD family hydrolase